MIPNIDQLKGCKSKYWW